MTETEFTRFGQRVAQGVAASFRCARCGEVAGVVRVARAGTSVDMGPPLGRQTYSGDSLVVDYFLGTSTSFAGAAAVEAAEAVVTADLPDPAALYEIDHELAPFYCPGCRLNYCRADWRTTTVFDGDFYDCTTGICPEGHQRILDD